MSGVKFPKNVSIKIKKKSTFELVGLAREGEVGGQVVLQEGSIGRREQGGFGDWKQASSKGFVGGWIAREEWDL